MITHSSWSDFKNPMYYEGLWDSTIFGRALLGIHNVASTMVG